MGENEVCRIKGTWYPTINDFNFLLEDFNLVLSKTMRFLRNNNDWFKSNTLNVDVIIMDLSIVKPKMEEFLKKGKLDRHYKKEFLELMGHYKSSLHNIKMSLYFFKRKTEEDEHMDEYKNDIITYLYDFVSLKLEELINKEREINKDILEGKISLHGY